MKQYYIYMVTNLITNQKYIGKHYGELDDSYYGSGRLLKQAIQDYGKENFKKEILHISKDEEENCAKEKHFIAINEATSDPTFLQYTYRWYWWKYDCGLHTRRKRKI